MSVIADEIQELIDAVEKFDSKIDVEKQPYLVEQMGNILCQKDMMEEYANTAYIRGKIIGICEFVCGLSIITGVVFWTRRLVIKIKQKRKMKKAAQ